MPAVGGRNKTAAQPERGVDGPGGIPGLVLLFLLGCHTSSHGAATEAKLQG